MAHRVSPQAEADLDDIWYYVAQESANIETANHFIDSITDRFFLLSRHPHLGRSRDEDLGTSLRTFPVGEYLIVYCIEDGDVLNLGLCMVDATLRPCLVSFEGCCYPDDAERE